MKKKDFISITPYKVNIFINDFDKFITNATILYYELLSNYVKQIIYYENKLTLCDSSLRKQAIANIIEGSTANVMLVKEMVSSLLPYAEIESILQKKNQKEYFRGANDTSSYLNDFKYLRRDWGWTKEGEYEISTITETLKNSIEEYAQSKNEAVFLGAGMGRIACEHVGFFNKVYAIDKSYSMGYFFKKLINEDTISFYEIRTSNVMKSTDSSKQHIASINHNLKNQIGDHQNFEYIVADAMNLPFENDSIDLIASVYFTDVIALKLYINEINRTLKKGGLFIHFGPLDYFFSDILERLSAEEITDVLTENNFTIVRNEIVELPHLDSSLNMYKKVCKNWFLVAIKN